MNAKPARHHDEEPPLLVLDDYFFQGTLMRYRYNTWAVIRRALICGLVVVLCLLVLTFLNYIYALLANLNPKPDFPLMLRFVSSLFFFAACYSVLMECQPQRLTMTSKHLSLKHSNNPFIRKPIGGIRNIQILYHSGTKLGLKIDWLQGHGPPWVVAGKIIDSTIDDPVEIIDFILDPEKLQRFSGPPSMRWKTQKQLQAAGWYPGRIVEDYIHHEMNVPAQKALHEYGGLHVSCIPSGEGTLRFEPPEDDRSKENIRYFSNMSFLKLSYIGVCDGDDYVPVVVSQYGYVYLLAGDEMRGIATSINLAIDRLIGGIRETDVLASQQLGVFKRETPTTKTSHDS